ncbi:YigZ family protein [bacterium]|nr:YigZ family protein [bacterium]
MKDAYLTIKQPVSHSLKVKDSRFIGLAAPVQDRDDAESWIGNIQKKYYDATHHCYAYRIGSGDQSEFRYNDDGEPSGTAGKPILDVLDGRKLTNCICLVTRYFGGTKLGTGGLARAYGRCAGETVNHGRIIQQYVFVSLSLVFDYDFTGTVMPLLAKYQCQIVNTQYGVQTIMTLRIRRSQSVEFQRDVINKSHGKVQFITQEEEE